MTVYSKRSMRGSILSPRDVCRKTFGATMLVIDGRCCEGKNCDSHVLPCQRGLKALTAQPRLSNCLLRPDLSQFFSYVSYVLDPVPGKVRAARRRFTPSVCGAGPPSESDRQARWRPSIVSAGEPNLPGLPQRCYLSGVRGARRNFSLVRTTRR